MKTNLFRLIFLKIGYVCYILTFSPDFFLNYFMYVPFNYALLLFTWFFNLYRVFSIELCSSFFALFCKCRLFLFHWIMPFCCSPDFLNLYLVFSIELCSSLFTLFCKFKSFVFHWIMPFLFSLQFPNVHCVPLNYAIKFLASFLNLDYMFSIELFPSLFTFLLFCVFHWIMPFCC